MIYVTTFTEYFVAFETGKQYFQYKNVLQDAIIRLYMLPRPVDSSRLETNITQ